MDIEMAKSWTAACVTFHFVEKSDTVKDKKALQYVSCCNNSKTGTRPTRNELNNLTYALMKEGRRWEEETNQFISYVKPLSSKNIYRIINVVGF